MYFHPELGPPPTAGIELEVVRWKNKRTMHHVAGELTDAGYMPVAATPYNGNRHDYHCRCDTCQIIGREVFFPPQWKMQRDASLPHDTGAEFISSPFPASEMFIEQALEAMSMIGTRADWRVDLPNERNTGNATPSMHVTVHAFGPMFEGLPVNRLRDNVAALYSFIPELFALSEANEEGHTRGLTYRMPHLYYEQQGRGEAHHSWLGASRGDNMFEWRFWEAAYSDVEYQRAAILISAALSQFVFSQKFFKKFEGIARMLAWDDRERSLQHIREQFSRERFDLLGDLIINATPIKADEYSTNAVEALLGRVQ